MEDETVHSHNIPITVNLTRPGRYFYKGCAFYVTIDGKAFLEYGGDNTQFKYDLSILDAGELDHRKIDALESIVREGLATKSQRNLWRRCLQARMLKQTYRKTKLWRIKRLNK